MIQFIFCSCYFCNITTDVFKKQEMFLLHSNIQILDTFIFLFSASSLFLRLLVRRIAFCESMARFWIGDGNHNMSHDLQWRATTHWVSQMSGMDPVLSASRSQLPLTASDWSTYCVLSTHSFPQFSAAWNAGVMEAAAAGGNMWRWHPSVWCRCHSGLQTGCGLQEREE